MTSDSTDRLPAEGLWRSLAPRAIAHARVAVASNERLARAGEPVTRLFFPVNAIVLIARQTPHDPVPLTVGLIGREGVVGWPALLDTGRWTHDAIAIGGGGDLLAVAVADLQTAVAAHPDFHRLLLRVVHNHMLQLAQSVVANLGHSVERRLARWLTMLDDRTTGDVLSVTHDELAQLLNVRRATVTDVLHVLEGERLIRNTRGRVQVRDRAALEARAGQSYGLSEGDYNATVGPFGKSSTARQP